MDGFMTTNEVAAEYGVSRQRVHQLRIKRQLPAIRAGHQWLYPIETVRTFERLGTGRPARKRELIAS